MPVLDRILEKGFLTELLKAFHMQRNKDWKGGRKTERGSVERGWERRN